MGSIMKFGKKVEKTEDNEFGWIEIYSHTKGPQPGETLLGHKSMVCFPGDGVIYSKDMNGCCSRMRDMLLNAGVPLEKMPQLYSVGFDTDTKSHRKQLLEQTGSLRYGVKKPDALKDYWTPFFNAYILPLLQNSDGQPRPVEETAKNLQNVTFVTHCHGSMFAQHIEQMLYDKVKEFYPGEEKKVMGNVRMLHLASRKEVGQETGAKHLNVISLADKMFADDIRTEDSIYKLLHKQSMDARSAIIPISDNESMMVFRELATQKTFGENRDDHRLFMTVVSGKGKKSDQDTEAQENEEGLKFVRSMLRHFVEHPDDSRPMKDIMNSINLRFVSTNLKDGQTLSSAMSKEEHMNKSFLDFLVQHSLRGVSGDAAFYLQKTSNGEYFYQQVKKRALETKDYASLRAVLKKVQGLLAPEIQAQEAKEAIARRDRRTVDILTDRMSSNNISKYILSGAGPEDLPFLYPEIKKAKLSENFQEVLIEDLLKKSQLIRNSTGRVLVQAYLKREKEAVATEKKQRESCISDYRQ